jgi:hypothetical protein
MSFRFTIRELVLLTAFVAMGMGWWLDHRRKLPMALLDALQFRGDRAVADVRAVKDKDRIRVFVMHGDGRGDDGKLLGTYPGGYTTLYLSRQGEVVQTIGRE